MNKSPKIFLTNDDGIHSPGLHAAARAVLHLGNVTVVAPSTQQTGMGRGFSGNMDAPLVPVDYNVNGCDVTAFQYEGSPALTVHHGLNVLCAQQRPDLLISGINYGENLGNNVTISGTIGAALEGASRGIPALAVSLQIEQGAYYHYSEQNWDVATHFLAYFANILLTHALPFDVDVLKVDVPDNATLQTPWRLTRLSRQSYYTSSLKNPSLESTPGNAKLHIQVDQTSLEPESDIHALAVEQIVSVTPLSLDCTSRADFQTLHDILAGV
jgi:5'-nucleotidase